MDPATHHPDSNCQTSRNWEQSESGPQGGDPHLLAATTNETNSLSEITNQLETSNTNQAPEINNHQSMATNSHHGNSHLQQERHHPTELNPAMDLTSNAQVANQHPAEIAGQKDVQANGVQGHVAGSVDQSDPHGQSVSNGIVDTNRTDTRPEDNTHAGPKETHIDQQVNTNNAPEAETTRAPFSPSPSPIPQRRAKRPAPRPSSPSPALPAPATPPHKRANFSPESSASPIPVRRSLTRRPASIVPGPSRPASRPASPPDHHPSQSPSKRSRQSSRLPSTALNSPHLHPKPEIGASPSASQGHPSRPPSQDKPKTAAKPASTAPPPPKPTRRPQRPIKRVSTQPANDPNPEDDFFNLSNRKQIHFVSKTLGLNTASPAPSNPSTSKSPTRASVDPPQKNVNLVDLSGDENSDEVDPDSDDMSEEDKKAKKNNSSRALPDWTKAPKILPLDSSSDEEIEGSGHPNGNGKQAQHRSGQKPGKGGKQADTSVPEPAKSRSPTPPPQQDEEAMRKAMKSLYKTLTHQDHVSSLQKQTLEAARKLEEARLIQTLNGLDDPMVPATYTTVVARNQNRPQGSNQPANRSLGAMITLTINMVMDPRVAANATQQAKDHFERPTTFNMQSGEKFDVIYQRFHELTGLPAHQLVVSYDHIKLSPFVTPESVRIYGNTALKVYESSAWEYVTSLRRQRAHIPSQPNEEELLREELKNLPLVSQDEQGSIEAAGVSGETQDVEMASPEPAAAGLLNLTVRTKDKSRVELSVKPTTTIRSIVKNTLIELDHPLQSQPPDPKKFKIHFDGQDLPFSSTVADHDLEDDDVIDLSFL